MNLNIMLYDVSSICAAFVCWFFTLALLGVEFKFMLMSPAKCRSDRHTQKKNQRAKNEIIDFNECDFIIERTMVQ